MFTFNYNTYVYSSIMKAVFKIIVFSYRYVDQTEIIAYTHHALNYIYKSKSVIVITTTSITSLWKYYN